MLDCPLGIFSFSNVIDIDILLVKKPKINAAFLIINKKVRKKQQSFIYRTLSTEIEIETTPFSVYKDCVGGVWVCTSCKFNQSGLKKLISCCFWWKSLNFVKFLARICDKKFNENSRQSILSLNLKSTTFSWKILLNYIKIGEILFKNSEKRWKKLTELTPFCRKFKPRYLPVKNENQKYLFNSIFYAAQAF